MRVSRGSPPRPIYSLVNQRIYESTCQIRAPAPYLSIFVGDVSPMNVTGYIHRLHVTDEYIVPFVGTDE
jgi:hypothetical protein